MATGELLRPRFPAGSAREEGVGAGRIGEGTGDAGRISSVVRVLAEDPDLATGMNERRVAAAEKMLVARAFSVATGAWQQRSWRARDRSGTGLLVLEGILMHRVSVGGRAAIEMLGAGDILRPWGRSDGDLSVHQSSDRWSVIRPARIAVLDSRFASALAAFPEVSAELSERALQRAQRLTVQMAVTAQPKVVTRLVGLLWQLAERWGRVRADGVVVELPLTHALLAELAGTCRPTVTLALRDLQKSGEVGRTSEGWLLRWPEGSPGGQPATPCSAG